MSHSCAAPRATQSIKLARERIADSGPDYQFFKEHGPLVRAALP